MKSGNIHTWAFTKLVRAAYDKAEREKQSIDDLIKIWPPRHLSVQHAPELGLDVGVDDYEEAGLTAVPRMFVKLLHFVAPRSDPNDRWRSPDEAREELRAMFGERLLSQVKWDDPTSDAALVRLATQGLAAHMLRRVEPGLYEVDLSFLLQMKTRPGFVPAGARLVLRGSDARSLELVSIRWARGEHRPGEAEWELAKLAFRVAVGIVGTVRDHAVKCHFLSANSAVIATRIVLPPTHDVRSLLRAFQFRTPAINSGALVTLIPRRAIFHRLFPFEWEGLSALYAYAKRDYRFLSLPDELREAGTHPEQLPNMPYAEDALEIWRLLETLVRDYLALIDAGEKKPTDDPDLVAFHAQLVRLLPPTAGLPSIDTREGLVLVLTRLLYDATGGHEQYGGGIGDYLDDLRFVVPNMRDGRSFEECLPSRMTMIQGTMLGVLTNFRMPGIRSDFAPLVPERGRPAVATFREGLGALAEEVKRRNATRTQHLVTFDPDHMEISVSI
ncbi:MAG: hypothetical protein J0L92_17060 [Deltaproteobacteria bacterium]|nr:hypothetical protein [Deltaproteobacteria bacterium]